MSRFLVTASWADVPHLDDAAKAGLLSSYMPHERQSRTEGIPNLGAGAIYPVPAEEILVDPFETPAFYRHVYALDVGWNRTAALWGALDPDSDTLYLTAEYYRAQAEPAVHAAAVRARGEWIPGVIDPASRGRSQKDGEQLFAAYEQLGLRLTPANNAVEAGIYEAWGRLSTGRLKVFRTLQNFLGEYRIYRRDEKGKIVKENDHLMDDMRYLCLSGIALAAARPFEQWRGRLGLPAFQNRPQLEVSYDPYAEARAAGGYRPQAQQPREGWWPGRR